MSKAKHPANMKLLTGSEHFSLNFEHICPITANFSAGGFPTLRPRPNRLLRRLAINTNT